MLDRLWLAMVGFQDSSMIKAIFICRAEGGQA